jgi:FHA domain
MPDRGTTGSLGRRIPVPPRRRKRRVITAGVAALWILLLALMGSALGATVLLLLMTLFAAVCVSALRFLGIGKDHPWVRGMATRPWRDGRDVLYLGLRHLSDVFIVTPSGSLLAPNAVELRMNPDDLASLTDVIDLGLVNESAAEIYRKRVAARSARLATACPIEVSVIADPEVLPGRYQIKQGKQRARVSSFPTVADLPEVRTREDPAVAETVDAGLRTVREPTSVPPLRLVTRGAVVETRVSGARAGRGRAAELRLPDVATVSRLHARFTFIAGQWRITDLSCNGVTLNGQPLTNDHVVLDGDSIRWGKEPDALASRVEIG